jgi:hypothetical protein
VVITGSSLWQDSSDCGKIAVLWSAGKQWLWQVSRVVAGKQWLWQDSSVVAGKQ